MDKVALAVNLVKQSKGENCIQKVTNIAPLQRSIVSIIVIVDSDKSLNDTPIVPNPSIIYLSSMVS